MICAAADLGEGGDGVRFQVDVGGVPLPAFAVRHAGKVRAYVNRCAHAWTELDWIPGKFFDDSGLYLVCATHGALFLPDTGRCAAGPCKGKGLTPLAVEERDGAVFLKLD